jgi:hypothetical protein
MCRLKNPQAQGSSRNLIYLSSEENRRGKGGRGPVQRGETTFSSVCPFVAKISAESQKSGMEGLKNSRRVKAKKRRREILLLSQGSMRTTWGHPMTTPRSRQQRTWVTERASDD